MACNKWYAAAAGLLMLAAGLTLFIGQYMSTLINNVMNNQLVITLDSPMYDEWMNPPPPIYMQYWLFNVTNPNEVIKGMKANVTEMGPYTYRLYQPRFNAAFYGNRSVAYQYNHTLVFQPDLSKGTELDVVTNVNVPLLTVSALLKYKNLNTIEKGILKGIIKILGDSDVFPRHTVKELLFGYSDKVLNLASELLSILGINFPGEFGIFYGFNNTDDGVYLINSGKHNISLANHIEKWNHEPMLNYWATSYANMLNGTDGVFFNPGLKENDTISAYSTDVCRSLDFHYEMSTSVKKVKTLRFHLTAQTFANNTINPDNEAFCSGHCLDSGVLNISVCKQNAPVIISSPHFYMGAKQYINGVNGLHPTKEIHETYLDVEPDTGTVCRANKRLQINIYLESSAISEELKNIKTTIFPFLWLNESVTIDTHSAHRLRGIFALKGFVLSIPYLLLGIGFVVFVGFIVCFFRVKKEKNYERLDDANGGDPQQESNISKA